MDPLFAWKKEPAGFQPARPTFSVFLAWAMLAYGPTAHEELAWSSLLKRDRATLTTQQQHFGRKRIHL